MTPQYLDRIGQLFFGVPPKQSPSYGGLLGELANTTDVYIHTHVNRLTSKMKRKSDSDVFHHQLLLNVMLPRNYLKRLHHL